MAGEALAAAVDHRVTPDRIMAACDPTYRRWPHAQLIGNTCVEAILDPDVACLIVTTPPQVSKSTTGNVGVSTWIKEWFPSLHTMNVSYTVKLARRNSRAVRDVISKHPDKLTVRLKSDQQAAEEWYTEQGGGMVAAGVDGQITGFPCTVAVVDDPHKNWAEAQSDLLREKAWLWLEADVIGRMSKHWVDTGNGSGYWITPTLIVIQTRYHEDDIAGRCQKYFGDRCRTLHLPALASPDIVDPDPLGRDPGVTICADRFTTAEYVERRDRMNPIIWMTLYQGAPAPTSGGTIDGDWWGWADRHPTPQERIFAVTSWDLTFKDTGKSWVVGQCWWIIAAPKHPGRHAYVLVDQIRRKADFYSQRMIMRAFAKQHPEAGTTLIEDAANGPSLISDLAHDWIAPDTRERWPALHGIVPVTPKGSKLVRAVGATPPIRDGRVLLPAGWWEPKSVRFPGDVDGDDGEQMFPASLINECRKVGQGGATDDEADAAVQFLLWAEGQLSNVLDSAGPSEIVVIDETLAGRR